MGVEIKSGVKVYPTIKEASPFSLNGANIKKHDFPTNLTGLKSIGTLPGINKPSLLKDGKQVIYVAKGAPHRHHMAIEATASTIAACFGLRVPEWKLYETEKGPIRLSPYLQGTQSLKDFLKTASQKQTDLVISRIKPAYLVASLVGNYDIIGRKKDNVVVDKHLMPWFPDWGASFMYRGHGPIRDDYGGRVAELDVLRQHVELNGNLAFGNLSYSDLERASYPMRRMGRSFMEHVPSYMRDVVSRRYDYILDAIKAVI